MSNNGDKLYQVLSLSLATARTNAEIFPTVPGGWDVIRVISSTNSGDILTVRFPNVTDDGFDLQPGRGVKLKGGIRLPRFFVTNAAIAGATMTLLVGGETGADIDVSDQVSVVSMPNLDLESVAGGFTQDMTRQLGLVDLQTAAAGFTSDITRLLGTTRPWWLNELRAGRAFQGGFLVLSVAGANGHVQLFNPAGSGVTVLVLCGRASLQTTGRLWVAQHNTAMGSLDAGINLLSGGAASVAQFRQGTNAGLLGTELENIHVAANSPVIWPAPGLGYGMELGAGEGIIFGNSTVNDQLSGAWYWIEF